jgi:hypothetical protein
MSKSVLESVSRPSAEGTNMNGVGTISPPDPVQIFDNEKLVDALYAAREQLAALKERVDKLCASTRPASGPARSWS